MKLYIAGILTLFIGACASPGIKYTARVPAENYAASQYRAVSVDDFSGPSGGWFSRRFAAMLDNVTFDGVPWFQASVAYDDQPENTGFYTGNIQIDHVDESDYYQTVKKCVEWDGLFDCEHRHEVKQYCIDRKVDLTVRTILVDAFSGRPVYESSHSGSASDGTCYDVGDEGYGGGHRGSGNGGLFSSRNAPRHLVERALSETLYNIRREIAPANVRAKARLITDAIDPEARADPRFNQAVELVKDGQIQLACVRWSDMATAYPNAPGVAHNLGACSEAMGDYSGAQTLYAKAVELSGAGYGGKADETILKALNRISTRRFDDGVLSELLETRGPVEADTSGPES